jgi:ATP-dependent Lon protease
MSATPKLSAEPVELPLLPLRDVVVFPHMVIPLFVGRPKSIKALEVAMEAGKSILLVAQKSAVKDEPEAEDLYNVGCVANILQMLKLPMARSRFWSRARSARGWRPSRRARRCFSRAHGR